MNILTCVLPQSDGQAESQYAAARKATQDRFGFYQVTSTWIFFLVLIPFIFLDILFGVGEFS